ncbi:class I SAM-dependent DNA methyltransferase [Gaopeijia maritima]|uniref:class I SAM-dependent DNA methyltransferase n=1 Tax=Gaopeijia maritima TaxID=3119007 RepID=UPI003284ED2D
MTADPPVGEASDKRYDRAYFDRWYRGEESPPGLGSSLERNVALAVAAAESVLDRPLRTVLDVGCGEGRWQPVLHALRPDAAYLGIDPSEYAVERFGEARNLRLGGFDELHLHVFDDPFDLVVCSDVMHYLDARTILRGLDTLVDLVGGVALLEVFTADDVVEGDREGFHLREPAWYRRAFTAAGLRALGLQLWVHHEIAEDLDALDLPMSALPGRPPETAGG